MPRPRRDTIEYRIGPVAGREYLHLLWTDERRRSKKVSTGTRDPVAAAQFLDAWRRERNAPPVTADQTTSALLDAYLEARQRDGVIDMERLRNACKPLRKHFGATVPVDISRDHVAGYRAFRDGRSAWTVRKELSTLRAALKWGEREDWFDKAPFIPLGRKPPPREQWMTREQAAALVEGAAADHVRLFIVLALYTAARRNAILGLTWDRVDFGTGMISYVDPDLDETDKRRSVVPMTPTVRAELVRARELRQTDHVIEWNGAPVANIKHGFRRAAIRAGLRVKVGERVGRDGEVEPIWRATVFPHVARHTCATWMAMEGVDLDKIADFLAADPATVWRNYRKFAPDYLREATLALEGSNDGGTKLRLERHGS